MKVKTSNLLIFKLPNLQIPQRIHQFLIQPSVFTLKRMAMNMNGRIEIQFNDGIIVVACFG